MRPLPWSPGYLAFVLPLKPEQVLRVEGSHPFAPTPESRREWAWIQTAQRLAWQYGCDGALERLNAYAADGGGAEAAA
ncbi:MAG: hypothetical protein Q8L59_11190 [Phenylobacterium sp.]|uniref:hypothetical protein n=1 Tax=Phenylobacterium sp. TaxID=1871053 RepID=UPI0027362B5F|nr:hypothetical protein [Phenylobacterium sp.]MDP1642739.1 hypothetical protein [Phenylobacterium sp.]MDP3117213.1 hypothetical protein [Phenylobacterium sp.]